MNLKGLVLFDIDGVIRDVSNSYRLAIQETVRNFTQWRPSLNKIDELKSEGCWNNDWDASFELLSRYMRNNGQHEKIPSRKDLINIFCNFYFGGDPNGDCSQWQGFIQNEPLLVDQSFFKQLNQQKIGWGFVSGAEEASARYVLENRIGLKNPPLISMGDAPEKPNPSGFLRLAMELLSKPLGEEAPPIAYLGDTVADVETVQRAKREIPNQKFISLALAPPHLHHKDQILSRVAYENRLKQAGADHILKSTTDLIDYLLGWPA